jgi:pyrimidine deaminase RibD-like protein
MPQQSAGDESAVARQARADQRWLREAIELSRRCPPSETAFSVGAVLVSDAGDVIATGYSRELDPKDHAEEVALAKAGDDPRLARATLYSSLEPCLSRASRPRSCAELIVAAGIPRVVIAWLEPPLFASGGGAGRLRSAGVTVAEIPWLADLARSVNAHLLPGHSR